MGGNSGRPQPRRESGHLSRLTKEFADLSPVVETMRELRKLEGERRTLSSSWTIQLRLRTSGTLRSRNSARSMPVWRRCRRNCAYTFCPRMQPTKRARSSRCAPAPAATKPPCSPPICTACTSRYAEQHGWKTDIISASENDLGGYKEIIASIAGKGVFRAPQIRVGRASRAAHTASPKPAGAFTPRRRRLPCCLRWRTSIWRSGLKTSASIPCARAVPAASTSTRPIRRCASPTCRPA